MSAVAINEALYCYHCGEFFKEYPIVAHHKKFCSPECEHIYDILEKADLLDYYTLTDSPGCCHKAAASQKDFSLLDEVAVKQLYIAYRDGSKTEAVFHLPEIHCSSCWWLIDNVHKLNKYIISSSVEFSERKAHIVFDERGITLRQVAELLASVGYEADLSAAERLKRRCCMGCTNSNGNCKNQRVKHFEVSI